MQPGPLARPIASVPQFTSSSRPTASEKTRLTRHRDWNRCRHRPTAPSIFVGAAIKGLKEIYREGLAYKRAGVMLLDLMDARQGQPSLFERPDPKDGQLIEAMDVIERRMGPGAIRFGHSVSTAR